MRARGPARAIIVSDSAHATLRIACDEFLGALAIQNVSGTAYNIIVDGLKFGLSGTGRDAVPVVETDIRGVPPTEALPSLIDSMHYSMAFAEAVISDQSASPNIEIQTFVRGYLTWLAKCIPASTPDETETLLALRVAPWTWRNAVDPAQGSFVPILPPAEYDTVVRNILDYLGRIQVEIRQNEQKLANRAWKSGLSMSARP